jgi:chromosome segregation ATPase
MSDLREQVKTMASAAEDMHKSMQQSESKLMDFKQWLHETKQQLQEANWREKSLTDDLAAAKLREGVLQQSVAEMDATIMQLEEANNNSSAQAETRRRQIEKCNADLLRASDEAKAHQASRQEAEKQLMLSKEDFDKTLKGKNSQLSAAMSAVEHMYTVICQVSFDAV